jgi:glycine cleavage system aminomethyltransferase T
VSVSIRSAEPSGSLERALHDAGAVFSTREGRPTVIHYGSPAGELAVCLRAVGLLDRSELTKLAIQAPPAQLGHLVTRVAGRAVAPGGALLADGAWWCRAADGRLIILCEPHVGRRLLAVLREQTVHHVAVTVRDLSEQWAAIELLGRRTGQVLSALGVYGETGDPRHVPPFGEQPVAGVEASWLLESSQRALALVPRSSAGDVWRAIELAGRSFGISCVGSEAARRYALLERSFR